MHNRSKANFYRLELPDTSLDMSKVMIGTRRRLSIGEISQTDRVLEVLQGDSLTMHLLFEKSI